MKHIRVNTWWMRRMVLGTAAGAAVLISSQSLAAQTPQGAQGAPAAAVEHAQPARLLPVLIAGQKVYIDPDTGRLRPPTPEEAKELSEALAAMMQRAGEDYQPIQGPDGMVSVVLGESYLDSMVATVNAQGALDVSCIPGKVDVGGAAKSQAVPLATPKTPELPEKE